jgi:hypothetical protein
MSHQPRNKPDTLELSAKVLVEVGFFQELVHRQPVMGGDKFQDTIEGANLDRMMIGNRDVELAVQLGCQADVRTVLPDAFVAQTRSALSSSGPETLRGSSRRYHFVTNEVKPDDLGHGIVNAIAKMTVHRIFDYLAQLAERMTLGNDGVPQGRGHIAAIDLVFLHFKDDLAHEDINLAGCLSRGKPPGGMAADKDFYTQDMIRGFRSDFAFAT